MGNGHSYPILDPPAILPCPYYYMRNHKSVLKTHGGDLGLINPHHVFSTQICGTCGTALWYLSGYHHTQVYLIQLHPTLDFSTILPYPSPSYLSGYHPTQSYLIQPHPTLDFSTILPM